MKLNSTLKSYEGEPGVAQSSAGFIPKNQEIVWFSMGPERTN